MNILELLLDLNQKINNRSTLMTLKTVFKKSAFDTKATKRVDKITKNFTILCIVIALQKVF